MSPCFKPQRGKFILRTEASWRVRQERVSNPNGVNLHLEVGDDLKMPKIGFKPQRGKFTHLAQRIAQVLEKKFQTPTG